MDTLTDSCIANFRLWGICQAKVHSVFLVDGYTTSTNQVQSSLSTLLWPHPHQPVHIQIRWFVCLSRYNFICFLFVLSTNLQSPFLYIRNVKTSILSGFWVGGLGGMIWERSQLEIIPCTIVGCASPKQLGYCTDKVLKIMWNPKLVFSVRPQNLWVTSMMGMNQNQEKTLH